MHPKKTARLAGLCYLLVVLTGPFVLIYVPNKLFVTGDASATVANILAHQTLMRAHIIVGLVSNLLFVMAVLLLFRLLKPVSVVLATLMAALILIIVPLAFLSVGNELAALTFVRNPQFLSVFDKPQRDAISTLFLQFDQEAVYASEVFWGLWLLPLGILVYRSRWFPRFLGVWLFVNGLAYVVMSLTGILAPQLYKQVYRLAMPVLFGEVALMLWLLIVGVRVKPAAVAVAPSDPMGQPS